MMRRVLGWGRHCFPAWGSGFLIKNGNNWNVKLSYVCILTVRKGEVLQTAGGCRLWNSSFWIRLIVLWSVENVCYQRKILTEDIEGCTCFDSYIQSVLCWTPVFSRMIPAGFKAQRISCSDDLLIVYPGYLGVWMPRGSAIECCHGTLSDSLIYRLSC